MVWGCGSQSGAEGVGTLSTELELVYIFGGKNGTRMRCGDEVRGMGDEAWCVLLHGVWKDPRREWQMTYWKFDR